MLLLTQLLVLSKFPSNSFENHTSIVLQINILKVFWVEKNKLFSLKNTLVLITSMFPKQSLAPLEIIVLASLNTLIQDCFLHPMQRLMGQGGVPNPKEKG